MTRTLGGPAIVLALVLAEVAIGGGVVLWAVPLWGQVRIAFWRLMGVILSSIAWLAFVAARGPLLAGPDVPRATGTAVALLFAFAVATTLWTLVAFTPARERARIVALGGLPIGVAALVFLAFDPAAARPPGIAMFQLLAGAAFAGAATMGMLLGHWYLVDRKLSREPLRRMNIAFLGGAAVAAVGAIFATGSGAGVAQETLSPLLGAGALAAYLAIGLIGLCAMIGFFIRALIKENSIQAATGLFYLGIIMGLSAEFAAKVRFF